MKSSPRRRPRCERGADGVHLIVLSRERERRFLLFRVVRSGRLRHPPVAILVSPDRTRGQIGTRRRYATGALIDEYAALAQERLS